MVSKVFCVWYIGMYMAYVNTQSVYAHACVCVCIAYMLYMYALRLCCVCMHCVYAVYVYDAARWCQMFAPRLVLNVFVCMYVYIYVYMYMYMYMYTCMYVCMYSAGVRHPSVDSAPRAGVKCLWL